MNRETFLRELEYLLQDMGEEERADALAYYRDYLDEAGPENEEKVIREFGSPERVAAMIRAGEKGGMEDGGEFTETGYGDERFKDPGYEVRRPERRSAHEESRAERGENDRSQGERPQPRDDGTSRVLKIVLWCILILVAAPVILGIGGSALSVVVGIAVAIFAVFFCIALAAAACLIGGIAAVAGGAAYLFADAFDGVLAMGIGFGTFGVGLLLLVLSVWFYGKFLPMIFCKVIDWANRLVHRGRSRA